LAIPRHLIEAVEVTESQIHLIRLKGIFDASTVNEFEKVVSYLLTRNFFCMVVDLSYVEFISSAGWGAFTAELRRVRENDGDIKLSGMNSDLFDVFLLLELDRFISAYESEDEAIMAFLQPPPEPVVETPVELPSALRENFDARPNRETIETKLPAIYEATSSAMMAQANDEAMDYREKYDGHDEAFTSESPASEFAPYNDDNWARRENFNADDTLEIESDQRLLGNGRERRELLLTSGNPRPDYSNAKRILPSQTLTAASDSLSYSGAAKSFTLRDEGDDTRDEAESGFYEHESTLDDHEPIAAPPAVELFSNSAPYSSGHGPDSVATHDNGGVADSRQRTERDAVNQRSKKFSWQEAEAFSELSLDLESHLQAPGRRPEAGDDFIALEDVHVDQQDEPPRRNNNDEATQKFNTIIFSPDEALAEKGVDDDMTFGTAYSVTADLKEDLQDTTPIRNNDYEDEDFTAPRFFDRLTEFVPDAHAPGKNLTPEHDDDFETQDIRDPWILEEIDTLPEEYEMDEAAAVYENRPIATEEFISYDFAADPEPPAPAPESQPGYEDAAPEIEKAMAAQKIEEDLEAPALVETPFENLIAVPPEEETVPSNFAIPAADSGGDDDDDDDDNDDDNATATATAVATAVAAADDDHNGSAVVNLPEAPEPGGTEEPLHAPTNTVESGKIPMSDDLAEMIRGIIAAYPHYGPTMIGKFLEERVEPPVYLSRSTIYRYLRESNLSTRRQRLEYAGIEFDLSAAAAFES